MKRLNAGRYFDEELLARAKRNVLLKADGSKYLNKRAVSANGGIILARWASEADKI
jgi:hypothetical protein